MSAPLSHDQIEAREREIFDSAPFEADHVPDAETSKFDARLAEPFLPTSTVSCVGEISIETGTPIELKTCQVWIDDCYSRGDRRRGRFKISESTHIDLKELDGVYAFLILDGEQIVAGRLVPAPDVDELVGWTNGGRKYKSRRTALPWFKIVPKAEVERGAPT